MSKKLLAIGIILYLASSTVSYFAFSALKKAVPGIGGSVTSPLPKDANGKVAFDETLPKTESCPTNGQLFSKQQRSWWEQHRPLGVMIENSTDARPQSGLSSADVVYEAVAEGGITRFLAVFYCQDASMVGPVRSARTYFVDFISEYATNPLYAHVGGANRDGPADALAQIDEYGWTAYNDINNIGVGAVGFPTFWRDYERLPGVDTEHTMYSTTEKLWEVGKKRKLTNVDEDGVAWDKTFKEWQFKDEAKLEERGATGLDFFFWDGYKDFAVKWDYNKEQNTYARTNGGKPHIDKNTDKQLATKNVVILFTTEKSLNDEEKHMLYTTKGSGNALFFIDGKVTEGTWDKANREARTKFSDKGGKEIKFNKGQVWIEVVAIGTDITY